MQARFVHLTIFVSWMLLSRKAFCAPQVVPKPRPLNAPPCDIAVSTTLIYQNRLGKLDGTSFRLDKDPNDELSLTSDTRNHLIGTKSDTDPVTLNAFDIIPAKFVYIQAKGNNGDVDRRFFYHVMTPEDDYFYYSASKENWCRIPYGTGSTISGIDVTEVVAA